MKKKTVTMTINPKDTRSLIAASLTCILTRQRELHDKYLNQVDASVREGTTKDILQGLSDILESFTKMAHEIDNVTPLILKIEEDLVPTDTEVVEDLPNLKEDSGRVD